MSFWGPEVGARSSLPCDDLAAMLGDVGVGVSETPRAVLHAASVSALVGLGAVFSEKNK